MGYQKTEWQTGDVITAIKLNNIENGIADGGVLVVSANPETMALDKTWQQIADAPFAVVHADVGEGQTEIFPCNGVAHVGSIYNVLFGEMFFVCNDPDDYPVYSDGGGGGDGEDISPK